jgi:osmotically inducible protein OsmC
MPVRTANAVWEGDLKGGKGKMKFGGFDGPYSFSSRFENGQGTNPEELLAAAHAGCFSMAFSGALGKAGFAPKSIRTTAHATIEKVGDGFKVTTMELVTEGSVPGIDNAKFQEIAEGAKKGCPVSQALAGVSISLKATLVV